MKRIIISLPWPLTAEETREVLSFAFQVSLVTYLGLYLLENIKPGFVTNYFAPDPYLWIAIASGFVSCVWPTLVPESKKRRSKLIWPDYVWLALLTLGTMVIVYTATRSLGWFANIIAPLSGLIIAGLVSLMYLDHDDKMAE